MNPLLADSYQHLLDMVARNRAEVVVGIRADVDSKLKQYADTPGYSRITISKTPLYAAPLYHLLHKKHTALVADIGRVLAEMAASGEIELIHQRTMLEMNDEISH